MRKQADLAEDIHRLSFEMVALSDVDGEVSFSSSSHEGITQVHVRLVKTIRERDLEDALKAIDAYRKTLPGLVKDLEIALDRTWDEVSVDIHKDPRNLLMGKGRMVIVKTLIDIPVTVGGMAGNRPWDKEFFDVVKRSLGSRAKLTLRS